MRVSLLVVCVCMDARPVDAVCALWDDVGDKRV